MLLPGFSLTSHFLLCFGITCLIDISGLREEDKKRIVCIIASAIRYCYLWEDKYEE